MKLLAGVIVIAAAQSGDSATGVDRTQRAFNSQDSAAQAALDSVANEDEYEYYYEYENDENSIARTRGKKTKKKRKKGSAKAVQAAAQASTNDYADNRNNGFDAFDSFNYNYAGADAFAGLDSDVNSLDLTINGDGKIGVINDADDFVDTQNWAFQHSLWGHAQDTRRTIAAGTPARLHMTTGYGAGPTFDVTNNHVARPYDSTREHEAKYGKTWYEATQSTGSLPYNAAWLGHNSENTVAIDTTAVNFGYNRADSTLFSGRNWMTEANHWDMGAFDSSWELGNPAQTGQVNQRWFQTIDAGRNGGGSVHGDLSRVKCFKCEVQYGLKWDNTNRHFVVDVGSHAGAGPWADCLSEGTENSLCEFSSGVCFVEERRLFGYITLVRKGCKQAQACYKNKAQNFLVQSGRQCWPGDARATVARVASRPTDKMSDQWIYNLVKGGSAIAGFGQDQTYADVATALAAGFDDSFTDTAGLAGGFYRTSGANFYDNIQPRQYSANGQVFNSWCYQCCNSGANCNKDWKPETEKDWAVNWLWSGSAVTPANDQA